MTDDTTGDRPPAIEQLDSLHVGPAPISEVLDAGRIVKRRLRTVLASIAAVTVLLVGGGFATSQVLGNNSTDDSLTADNETVTPTTPAAPHTLTVDAMFKPGGKRFFYFEGALEEIRLEREEPSGAVPVRSEVAPAPWKQAWADLPPGEYTLYAAVRPCGGNCGSLDPPTDSCEQTFDLDADRTVKVEFDFGAPCIVTVALAEGTSADLSVDVNRYLSQALNIETRQGAARWEPRSRTVTYVSRLDYSGSCPPEGSVELNGGALILVLAVTVGDDQPCTADANTMLATISGLTEAPAELAVTEEGETRTIPVLDAEPGVDEPGGDPAVWAVAPGKRPAPTSTTFTAAVSRLGCNSGVTGEVLEPRIEYSPSDITVTFQVAADRDGGLCPSNLPVEVQVNLTEPIGDRDLIDGQCRPDAAAATTSFCTGSKGVR